MTVNFHKNGILSIVLSYTFVLNLKLKDYV